MALGCPAPIRDSVGESAPSLSGGGADKVDGPTGGRPPGRTAQLPPEAAGTARFTMTLRYAVTGPRRALSAADVRSRS